MGLFDFLKKKENKNAKLTTKQTMPFSNTSAQDDVIPIEERIRGRQPTCGSLYPHEVLVLSYADKYNTSGNEFQGFWWYRYGIKDVQAVLSKLESDGFITVGTVADALANKKLPELKRVLQAYGLKVSGKKVDIVQRIIENVPAEEIDASFLVKPYKRTDSGEALLKKFEWIPYIHSHSIDGLDIWSLTEKVQTPPYMKYRDKIWRHFNKLGMEYAKNAQFGLYRNIRFQMSEFLVEEHKERGAFSLRCEVLTYDLSGLSNGFNPQNISMNYQFFYPYEKSIVTIVPGITDRIKKMSDSFGWSEKELMTTLLQEISDIKLPFTIFTPEEKVQIVLAEMNEDTEKLDLIYNASARRFKKQYKVK